VRPESTSGKSEDDYSQVHTSMIAQEIITREVISVAGRGLVVGRRYDYPGSTLIRLCLYNLDGWPCVSL
jgi:hypothetical protein